jgi:hypothetical protein
MKHWLSGLLLGTALVAAQDAMALTLVSPGQNLQDPSAKAVESDGDAPIQRLTPPGGRDAAPGTVYRSRDGGFSMNITPYGSNGFGDNRLGGRAPYATNSPYWGMEPGAGFRTLNQQ